MPDIRNPNYKSRIAKIDAEALAVTNTSDASSSTKEKEPNRQPAKRDTRRVQATPRAMKETKKTVMKKK